MPEAEPAPQTPPPPARPGALERARRDLAAGRPDLARERLTGFLYTLHRRGAYSAEAYLLLGQAAFEMRDFARAGAAWLLTEKPDADAERATREFHARFGHDPVNVLRAVKPRAPSELYPPAVQERLRAWNYRYRPYRPRSNPHALEELRPAADPRALRPAEIGCAVLVLLFTAFAALYLLKVLGIL